MTTQIVPVFSTFSSESFGTPTLVYNQTINPSSISSSETFGLTTLVYAQTVNLDTISSSELLGFVNVITVISPTSISSLESFGNASFAYNQQLVPIHINSAESFGNLTTQRTINPSSIVSSESFGNLLIANGAIIVLDTIVSQEFIPNTHVLIHNQTVFPSSIVSGERVTRIRLGITSFCVHTESYYPSYAIKNGKLIKRVGTAIVPGITVCNQDIGRQTVKL